MALDVSTGGELAVALAGGRQGRAASSCHGNNKSSEELAAALAAGVGRIVVDSFDEIDRLRDLTTARTEHPGEERANPVAAPGDARDRGAHPRVREDRAGGHEVRLLAGFGSCCRGGRALRRLDPASSSSACTPTSAARSSSSTPSPRSSPRSPRSWSRTVLASAASAAGSVSPTSRARWPRPSPSGRGPRTRRPRPAGLPPAVRLTAEPGRAIVAARRRDAVPGRHHQAASRAATVRRSRRRHVRQPAARPLRQRLRGLLAPVPPGSRGRWRPGSSASTASPATSSSTTPGFPPTSSSATCSRPRSPAPTASPCPPTTTGCCGPPSCSSPEGRCRVVVRRETMADLLAREA